MTWDEYVPTWINQERERPDAGVVVLVYPGNRLSIPYRKGVDAWLGLCVFGSEGNADYRALTYRALA